VTGSAPATAAGTSVTLSIYSGTSTSATPVRSGSATVASGGAFSFTVTPALPDGAYTVVARATINGAAAVSAALPLIVKVNPPAMTMIVPTAGQAAARQPVFFGLLGTAPGDLPTVTVKLYPGPSADGSSVGTVTASRAGVDWIATWPRQLPLGIYTAEASESDSAGHTATATRTFLVVNSPPVIGSVNVSQNGLASVSIVCTAAHGKSCHGTVTVASAHPVALTRHGSSRRITLFRVRFAMGGGVTQVIRARLSSGLERSLRRLGHLQVAVAAVESTDAGSHTYRASRRATFMR
jgi:hypothetical protein